MRLNKKIFFMVIIFFITAIALNFIFPKLSFVEMQRPSFIFGSIESKNMPSDRIADDKVIALDNKVVVYISDAYLAKFTDTHSMEPVLNSKSTGIEIIPKSEAEIKIGDIISYESEYSNEPIIHRVVKIGYDGKGWYAITKGDNNPANDPEKVRFNKVKRVLVGVLY